MYLFTESSNCHAQNDSTQSIQKHNNGEAVRIFLDCNYCDFDFIRKNIPFVNFTRDPELAQVHIIVSINRTGSGGRRYNLKFIGRESFSDIDQNLEYTSAQSDSRATRNEGLTVTIKMGLMPYIAQTDIASKIKIEYDSENGDPEQREGHDRWNSWIFYFDLMGELEMEESQNQLTLRNSFRANRTTDEWKFRSEFEYVYEEENFEDDDEKIKSILRETESDILVVKSLTNKWSAGLLAGANTTTFRNTDLKLDFGPAIEYNFFPWKILDQKILTVGYHVGIRSFKYIEETIYNRKKEILPYEALRFELELRQTWGEVDFSVEGSHYFKDFSFYQIELMADVSFRITKGLSIFFDIEAESIHDQLYLAKGDASLEEILLKRRQLSTQYDLEFGFGIRYSFGSIYNNIVNRRM